MIKSDNWILTQGEKLVKPFYPEKVSRGVISYGTSQCGYDLTLNETAYYYRGNASDLIDVKDFDKNKLTMKVIAFDNYLIINSRQAMLCSVNEHLTIPNDIMGLAWGKSTYSRVEVNVYCQPIEPGWKGYLSILVVNYNPNPVKLYVNEGILQIVFFELDTASKNPYKDGDKYQGQGKEPTFSKIAS